MDYDKLIERLRNAAGGPEGIKMCQDAATAIEALRAENEKLRKERDEARVDCAVAEKNHANCIADLARVTAERDAAIESVKRALAMMWFAYVNSDKEFPHTYETEALEEAERILGPWAECMPKYLRRKGD